MSKEIKEIYKSRGVAAPKCERGGPHHSAAFHRYVAGMKASGKGGINPYAIATAKLQKEGKKVFK
ncbi:MAG TPA: hypothetical protein VMW50_08185 [Dehalococcoidia bacterium]|nr:hypothetical protein [Dehalococcoidia bacterium]